MSLQNKVERPDLVVSSAEQLESSRNEISDSCAISDEMPCQKCAKPQRVALHILTDFVAQPISLFGYFLEYEHNADYHEKKVVNYLWH